MVIVEKQGIEPCAFRVLSEHYHLCYISRTAMYPLFHNINFDGVELEHIH